MLLTAIPFLYTGLIKPRQDKEPKWRNIFSVMGRALPPLEKACTRFKSIILGFRERMSHSKSARKFFTMFVIVTMLTFQFIDSQAMSYTMKLYDQAVMNQQTDLFVTNVTGPMSSISNFIFGKTNKNWIYPYLTSPIVYYMVLLYTIMLFSNRIASIVFNTIRNDKMLYALIGAITITLLFIDEGRYLLMSETMFITIIASTFWPQEIYPEQNRFNNGRRQVYFN